MLKYVNIYVYLTVFLLCDAFNLERQADCFDKHGLCPRPPNCYVPEEYTSCTCDSDCKSNYICCSMCLEDIKLCQPVSINQNTIELVSNIEDLPLKETQDSVTFDKELKQMPVDQQTIYKGLEGKAPAPVIKFNSFYNIIKNVYIQNLNVYQGLDKPVHNFKDETLITTTEFDPYLHLYSVYAKHETTPLIKKDQACLDDEDCQISGSGSGSLSEKTNFIKTNEGSGHFTEDDEDLHFSGHGFNFIEPPKLEEIKFSEPLITDDDDLESVEYIDIFNFVVPLQDQLEKPKSLEPLKTLEATEFLYFEEESGNDNNNKEKTVDGIQ